MDEVLCGSVDESRTTVDSIAVSPAEWTSIEFVLRVTPDSFAVADRPHRTVVLEIVRLAPAFLAKHLGTPVGRRRAGADAR